MSMIGSESEAPVVDCVAGVVCPNSAVDVSAAADATSICRREIAPVRSSPCMELPRFVALLTALLTAGAFAEPPTVKPEDLPRVKPTEPVDALKTFQIKKGYKLQLIAAEP